jgi:SAM-dependent methyltransferase
MPTLQSALLDDLRNPSATPASDLFVEVDLAAGVESAKERILAACASGLSQDREARAILVGSVPNDEASLAALRNALWPVLHVNRVYRSRQGRPIERIEVESRRTLDGTSADHDGFVLVALRRLTAMSPTFTQEKFDRKASGWNGHPGSPGYGHFRWMRRLLSDLSPPRAGERVLDAGSGAGWVGIEAGKKAKLARLAAFDPSSEMVKFVVQNARDNGLEIDARVGFVEEPPFQEQFDLVYNSGVISFAPEPQRFLDGIDRVVKKGGRLVIGDLNPNSSGFARRRREKAVLPNRELNGVSRDRICEWLTARGYTVEFKRFYQLTWPIPEIAHRSGHFVCACLLGLNRAATAIDGLLGSPLESLFDSWIVGATRRT